MKTYLAIFVAATLVTSATAIARNSYEEVIVISSRVDTPLRQMGTSVSVVTDENIKQLGLDSLADVLRTQPAVAVSNSGGAGAVTALRIRGEEGFRTLVLVDGMDISDAAGTQVGANFENLLSSSVHRVEILRGPQGMMYGADAGGVVSIQSRPSADGFGGEFSAAGGRFDSRQFAGSIGGRNELGDVSLSAADYQTKGFNARDTDTTLQDKDGYKNTTLHGRGAWNATEKLRLQLTVRKLDTKGDYDSCFDASFVRFDACTSTFEQTGIRLSAHYRGERLVHDLAYSRTATDRAFFSAGSRSFTAMGELEKYEYLGSFSAANSVKLIYGADLKTESVDDAVEDRSRNQAGLYIDYQRAFSDVLFLTAGARYDNNDDFGHFTSYRLSAAWLLATSIGPIKLKSSFGTGFRAPSLYEISYNSGSFAYPPASTVTLGEEKSRGLDIGVEYFANSGIHLEAVYFEQSMEDEIFFDLSGFSGYLQGAGDTDSSGLELIVDLPLSDIWQLTGNYTYNATRNLDGGTRVRRPRHLANVGIAYRHSDGRFSANLYARSSYHAIDIDGSELDDYTVITVSGRFNITAALQIYGRVENLFDTDYQEVPTYNTAGVAGYAGVRYAF